MGPISSFIVDRLFTEVFDGIKTYLKGKGLRLLRNESEVRDAIYRHITYVNNWSKHVTFKDLDKKKDVSKIYVDLTYYQNLRRDSLHDVERRPIKLREILGKDEKHIVVLGQPGAGKTTTMKYICQSIFHKESFHPGYRIPVLVRLRDLSNDSFSSSSNYLFDILFEILGLKINNEETKYPHSSLSVRECVIKMLDGLDALVILDGFDEINPSNKKEKIIKEFEYLSLSLSRSRIILTSRIGDYNYSIDNTKVYEISSLTDPQIELFAKKWLGKKEKYAELQSQIQKSPFYDTAIRPLTMAHLCAIYDKYGWIPDKPKNIYRKIVGLLIEEWDAQRMILRNSSFTDFTPDRKAEFLSVLSFYLTSEIKGSIFTKAEISKVYKKIHKDFSLKLEDERKVMIELESQTGLLLQSGYDSFEFAHKSLQEYLAAEYILKLPFIPSDMNLIMQLPNELAIATALSIDPSTYFAALVIKNFSNIDANIVRIFLTRIILENPDFRTEPLLAAAILYLRRLNKVKNSCDLQIYDLIQMKSVVRESVLVLRNHYKISSETRLGDEEIILLINQPYKQHEVEAPLAIQVSQTILRKLGLDRWG